MMDLKNAACVCLISLFAATLVVLIARALDMQAAARIEPQLVRIVEELEALRASGGLAAGTATGGQRGTAQDALFVYYFHGSTRCPTCREIESQSRATVFTDFAGQLQSGELIWKTLNYEEPAVADLAEEFAVQIPVVVLAQMQSGEIGQWKRLDDVWALVGEEGSVADYVRREVSQMLPATASDSAAVEPAADEESSDLQFDPAEIPVPEAPLDIPVP